MRLPQTGKFNKKEDIVLFQDSIQCVLCTFVTQNNGLSIFPILSFQCTRMLFDSALLPNIRLLCNRIHGASSIHFDVVVYTLHIQLLLIRFSI